MKKQLSSLMILTLLVTVLTSCLPETPEPPYGVWVSEEHGITLFLKPEYRLSTDSFIYIGLYVVDNIEKKAFALFRAGTQLLIYDELAFANPSIIRGDYLLLAGSYRVIQNKIHWTLTPHFQEQKGVRTIIFQRTENYTPIDPYHWSPYFFPRNGGEDL